MATGRASRGVGAGTVRARLVELGRRALWLGSIVLLVTPAYGQSREEAYKQFGVEMEQIIAAAKEHMPSAADQADAQVASQVLHDYKKYVAEQKWRYAEVSESSLRHYTQHLKIRLGLVEAPKPVAIPKPARVPSGPDEVRRWIANQNRKAAEAATERAEESSTFVREIGKIIFEAGQATATKSEQADLRALQFMLHQYKQHVAANEWQKANELKEKMRVTLVRSGQVAAEAPRRLADWQREAEERRHREELAQRQRQHEEAMAEQRRRHNQLMNGLWTRPPRYGGQQRGSQFGGR